MTSGRRLLSATEVDYLAALGAAPKAAPNGEERHRAILQILLAIQRRRIDGVSLKGLAHAVGFTVITVRKWQRAEGDHKPPAFGLLAQLDRTALDPSWLLVDSTPTRVAVLTGHDDGAGHRFLQEARDVMDLLEPLGLDIRVEPAVSLPAMARCLERYRPHILHLAGRHAYCGFCSPKGGAHVPHSGWTSQTRSVVRAGRLASRSSTSAIPAPEFRTRGRQGLQRSSHAGVLLMTTSRTFTRRFYRALPGWSVEAAYQNAVLALAPHHRHYYELQASPRAAALVIVR